MSLLPSSGIYVKVASGLDIHDSAVGIIVNSSGHALTPAKLTSLYTLTEMGITFTPTVDVDFNSVKLSSIDDPVALQDAVTLNYFNNNKAVNASSVVYPIQNNTFINNQLGALQLDWYDNTIIGANNEMVLTNIGSTVILGTNNAVGMRSGCKNNMLIGGNNCINTNQKLDEKNIFIGYNNNLADAENGAVQKGNLLLGYGISSSAGSSNYQTIIGYAAEGKGSNTVVLGSAGYSQNGTYIYSALKREANLLTTLTPTGASPLGSAIQNILDFGLQYKKIIVYFNGGQGTFTITFPYAFTILPLLVRLPPGTILTDFTSTLDGCTCLFTAQITGWLYLEGW
jgi:carbonic anhydrase/acetyltransferase-like protein (isoleucine patch superfamily)